MWHVAAGTAMQMMQPNAYAARQAERSRTVGWRGGEGCSDRCHTLLQAAFSMLQDRELRATSSCRQLKSKHVKKPGSRGRRGGGREESHTHICNMLWHVAHTHTQHLRLRLRLCRHLSLSSSYDFAFNLVASLLLIAILNMLHFIVATHTHTDTQKHSHTLPHTHTPSH